MDYKTSDILKTVFITAAFTIVFATYISPRLKTKNDVAVISVDEQALIGELALISECEIEDEIHPSNKIEYVSLGVPDIDSSFKSWMSYKAVTNTKSDQYKFINTYGYADSDGFMRCAKDDDFGVEQDYYLIALGSYYGTTIGTKYKITLDTGKFFYGVLGDCKADVHTNSTNQYVPMNGNVVEFIVDTAILNSKVKRLGSANCCEQLNGRITKIEKMNFIVE